MKQLFVSVAVVLLALWTTACGIGVRGPQSVRLRSPAALDSDHDDGKIESFGQPAPAGEEQEITAVVRSYYAAAAADDGVRSCSMIYAPIANSVPNAYGKTAALSGKTCPVVMTKFFAQRHQRLVAESPSMTFTHVRVSGKDSLVFLAFKTVEGPREIGVTREKGSWKMAWLIDAELP